MFLDCSEGRTRNARESRHTFLRPLQCRSAACCVYITPDTAWSTTLARFRPFKWQPPSPSSPSFAQSPSKSTHTSTPRPVIRYDVQQQPSISFTWRPNRTHPANSRQAHSAPPRVRHDDDRWGNDRILLTTYSFYVVSSRYRPRVIFGPRRVSWSVVSKWGDRLL